MLDIDISVKVYAQAMPETTTSVTSVPSDVQSGTSFPYLATGVLSLVLALTVAAESLPAAIMPQMAATLGADNLQIGLLLSAWAVTVILASIPLARLTRRIDRRLVVSGSLAVFALGSLGTALAPTYEIALVTRVVTAAAHGLLWSVVIVYATAILDSRHLGRGLAIVTGGVTVALALGLPAGAAIALVGDWCFAFLGVGVLVGILSFVVARFLPRVASEASVPAQSEPDAEPAKGDASRAPVAALLAAALVFAFGHFTLFAYITPYLTDAAHFDAGWTGPLLALFGAAGFVGILVSGLTVDRWPSIALPVTFASMAVATVALAVAPAVPALVVAGVFVWGVAMGAMSPLVQTAVMRTASPQLRATASAALVVSFNSGIAAGSWVGGVVESTAGTPANAALTAVASTASVVLVLLAQKLASRARA
ncbi:putative MFS family arabinose efflux permease [Paramicrobacterium agarici]|uniref:Putative MFS family arabinose efflux permease n=2 Tax=Paramicrobacterium agarici TaxID=630514 RepID=A0A2A9E1F5_9MICO|nr:putative MFS family arabinose efflux permease [Microbacterium agarici]